MNDLWKDTQQLNLDTRHLQELPIFTSPNLFPDRGFTLLQPLGLVFIYCRGLKLIEPLRVFLLLSAHELIQTT